ncbi:MAG: Gfo/Idh/MocA family oxidoreductase [Pseudomonadota bacterium]
MMAEKLRVAVAGTGYFSQFHYDAWQRCPEVEIVGIADRNGEAAQSKAHELGTVSFDDTATMLDAVKPDALDIITPPPTHFELIEQASSRGITAICQKPFCGTLDIAERAVERVARKGTQIIVHENFRFMPWFGAIKSALDEDRLGRLFQITFRLRPGDGQGPQAYLERQPYFQTMERFLVHETAIHYVDVFRYLAGEVTDVSARLDKLNPVIAGEDACLITMGFEGGARGLIDGNRLSDHRADNRRRTMGEMLVEGEKGVLELDGEANLTFRAHGSNTIEPIAYDWNDHGFGADCVYRFTRHVVDHLLNGLAVQNTGADYLSNLRIEEAIYRSHQTGRVVALD